MINDKHYSVGMKRYESYDEALQDANRRLTNSRYRTEEYVYVSVAKVERDQPPFKVTEIK